MRVNPVKRVLKAGKPSVGTWLSLGSITAARMMARTGSVERLVMPQAPRFRA